SWLGSAAARMMGDAHGSPLIEDVSARAYTIPTDQDEADATLSWDSTTLVWVTARAGGRSGSGWTYAPAACTRLIEDLLTPALVGQPAFAVPSAHEQMRVVARNAGLLGPTIYAISAVDVALWDLKARLLDVSLADLLGAITTSLPVYGSGGFTTYDADTLRDRVEGWLAQGVDAVKIKIGESSGTNPARDLERVAQARELIGANRQLLVDANGGYRRKQAARIGRHLNDLGVVWFEEPVSSDDKSGLAQLSAMLDLDVAAGEYANDLAESRRLCEVVDCLQIDATRCGGITGWLRTAALAASFCLDVSGHCAPHLQALAAMATPNLRHLEWFHDHVRIEGRFIDGCGDLQDGRLVVDPGALGHGYTLKERDLEPYRV
ncbi:MAG: enolase C-terminal domain-like protein, partial [Marmoricola sp.]